MPVLNLYHLGVPAGTVLLRRPGTRRQNDNVSVRSDVTNKANTIILDVSYKAKSRMENANYETKLPVCPTSLSRGTATTAPSGRSPSRLTRATPLPMKP